MTVIDMTAAEFITAWEGKTISEIAMVRETPTYWYIFVKDTPPDGGEEMQAVIRVVKP